ncbi:MAG: restriction endonuclease subunit S [Clostridia bacterium]|nr:restriction endonuclease subunit S [Clostridia bacterium]
MPKTINVKIGDLFKPINGNSKYTKSYCNDHSGKYVVYTGTTIGVFGKVDHADYTEPNLTFTTDGEKAGTLEYIQDEGYCIGGHRTILKPIKDNLYMVYFKYILQPVFYENVKRGDVPSLHFNRIKNIEIPVPIKEEGIYDINSQKEMAEKHETVYLLKRKLCKKMKELESQNVQLNLENDVPTKELSLNDIIKHHNGNSKYTIEWCNNNIGDIPVYSANNNKPFAYMNSYDYCGRYLTYSKNGCAGFITIIDGKFSINGDRCVISIIDKYKETICIDYLKWYLEPIFRANKKGRMGINGKNEYTKINSTMIKKLDIKVPFPINNEGDIDFLKQKELANKYATIDYIKNEINSKINELVQIKIEQ